MVAAGIIGRVRSAVEGHVELLRRLPSLIDALQLRTDPRLSGSLTILCDLPFGAKRYLPQAPGLKEILDAMEVIDHDLVIFQERSADWAVRKGGYLSPAELKKGVIRNGVFLRVCLSERSNFPTRNDMAMVRKDGIGLILMRRERGRRELPMILFTAPKLHDSGSPIRNISIAVEDEGLSLTDYAAKQLRRIIIRGELKA